MRRKGETKNVVFGEQDFPLQPEIAPQFCRREILVGIPLPTPSKAGRLFVGSLCSQHGSAMKAAVEIGVVEKLLYKGKIR